MDFVWPSVINYNWDIHPVVNIFHAVDGKRVLKWMVDGGSLLIRVLVFDSNLSYLFPPLLPRLFPVASGQVVKMAPYIMIGIGISCVNITNASLLSPHKPVIPARKVVYTPRGGWSCGKKSCSDRSFVDRCLIYRRWMSSLRWCWWRRWWRWWRCLWGLVFMSCHRHTLLLSTHHHIWLAIAISLAPSFRIYVSY